jgi:Holliday junction resolvasome RuvABC endonuclease subunit
MIIGLATARKLPLRLVNSQKPKELLTGDRNADKDEVMKAVFKEVRGKSDLHALFTLKPKYQQEAISDALAVFLYFASDGAKTNTSTTGS